MIRNTWEITSVGEWLRRRQGMLTASRISALFDEHPYMTRDGLVAALKGIDQGDSPAMRRGRIIEPAIIEAMREEHPDWAIHRANTFHWLPEYRIGATPDAWASIDGVPGIIQCKSVAPEIWEKWRGRPPLGYSLQTLTELLCTGRSLGVLAVMVMDRALTLHEFSVPRHAAAEQKLLDAAFAWWEAWDRGEVGATAPDAELAEMLDDGSTIDLSDNNYLCEAVPERQQLRAAISASEKRVAEIDDSIKTAMGQASIAYLPGWTLTFKAQTRREVLIPAKTFRTLRVAPMKDDT